MRMTNTEYQFATKKFQALILRYVYSQVKLLSLHAIDVYVQPW